MAINKGLPDIKLFS